MASTMSGVGLRQIRTLWGEGTSLGLSDAQLLNRFQTTRGESADAAFAAIVVRHGAMVLGVCRRILNDPHDAEDAFQATFLVLIKKAGSVRVEDSLGRWLHGVSYRIALRARAAGRQRTARELVARSDRTAHCDREGERSDVRAVLDDELSRLPEKYRAPMVLCYLEGSTHEEAASQLGWPLGTVRGRLARGRDRLRDRLTRRGIAPSVVLPASGVLRSEVSSRLADVTVRAAAGLRQGSALSDVSAASVSRLLIGVSTAPPVGRLLVLLGIVISVSIVWLAASTLDNPPAASRQAALDAGEAAPRFAAPRELVASTGRGLIVAYDRDKAGNRIQIVNDGIFKETLSDLKWVVVTGVIDHKALRAERARKFAANPATARPEYRRVALERQERRAGGDWSSWAAVDRELTDRVLDDLPEQESERTPDEVRPDALVDPLPYLKTGSWRGVDVPRFVIDQEGNDQNGKKPLNADPDEVMIRALDFTVDAGAAYRYRARVVIEGEARRGRRTEWSSSWSTPTNEVRVPAN